MKKVISIILSIVIISTLAAYGYASEMPTEVLLLQKISRELGLVNKL